MTCSIHSLSGTVMPRCETGGAARFPKPYSALQQLAPGNLSNLTKQGNSAMTSSSNQASPVPKAKGRMGRAKLAQMLVGDMMKAGDGSRHLW